LVNKPGVKSEYSISFLGELMDARYARVVALYAYQGICVKSALCDVIRKGEKSRDKTYEPHSLGAKRVTPARTEASMRAFWAVKASSWSRWGEMKDKTVWTPRRALASSATSE
jgi:hypothetical protein